MEREYAQRQENPETGRTLKQERTRALALAFAHPGVKQPNGSYTKKSFYEILDGVVATDPAFADYELKHLSAKNNGTLRSATRASLRRLINILSVTDRNSTNYFERDFIFSESVFAEIQELYPDRELVPDDLYEIFRITPVDPENRTNQRIEPLSYIPTKNSGPGMDMSDLDWDTFWANYNDNRPRFIGKPTDGFVQTVSQKPLADSSSSIRKTNR